MEIKLNNDEMVAAIIAHVRNQGVNLEDKSVDVVLTAGRGDTGHYATINIEPTLDNNNNENKGTTVTSSPAKEESGSPEDSVQDEESVAKEDEQVKTGPSDSLFAGS